MKLEMFCGPSQDQVGYSRYNTRPEDVKSYIGGRPSGTRFVV